VQGNDARPRPPLGQLGRRAPLVRVFRRVDQFVDVVAAHHGFDGAASIAFWFFLSLVPLLVFAGWILGAVARSRGADFLLNPILDLLPGAAAESLVREQIERMSRPGSDPVAPLAVVGFLWSSSSGLHNLMDVFENAVKVARRPWWKQRLLALGWVVVGLVTAAATAWLLTRVDTAFHGQDTTTAPSSAPSSSATAGPVASSDDKARRHGDLRGARNHIKQRVTKLLHTPAEQTVGALVMLSIGTTFLAGFYRLAVVHPAGVRRRAWPGALVAVAIWVAVSWGFGTYVGSLGDYALYYGGLAAVAVILVWLYLTGLALVLGAVVNAQLEGIRD
jgi:membrane protein